MTSPTMIIGATPTVTLARLHQLVAALESAVATGTREQAIKAVEDVHLAVIQASAQARKASDWRGAIERTFGEARG
jgi:DNA-binding GntR family transcriptional regulator